MIEWHRVKDELPPYDTNVLVAVKLDNKYAPEGVINVRLIKPYGDNIWYGIGSLGSVEDDDQWAYINLPKKDGNKDGDSD